MIIGRRCTFGGEGFVKDERWLVIRKKGGPESYPLGRFAKGKGSRVVWALPKGCFRGVTGYDQSLICFVLDAIVVGVAIAWSGSRQGRNRDRVVFNSRL